MILQFIFWLSLLLICYTYLIYPWWMKLKGTKNRVYADWNKQPKVAVLIAAYNEEKVIAQKLLSTVHCDYPLDKLEIWVGSDCSTDRTDEIVREFSLQHPQVRLHRFTERTGKPEIINQLVQHCKASILILTDADTYFETNTISKLVNPFQYTQIGGVQAGFISSTNKRHDVARQELVYNDREVMIKRGQSVNGKVIGAYGACYAVRKELYSPVPKDFLVDDFYIFMKVQEQGFDTVLAENASCRLEISGQSKEEFKRKVRIGTGNFQNFFALKTFKNPVKDRVSFYYWSHKVLRWFTPFFLLTFFFSNLLLINAYPFFTYVFLLQCTVLLLIGIDYLLKRSGVKTGVLRFVSHFVAMNLALLLGFFRYLRGVKGGTWR